MKNKRTKTPWQKVRHVFNEVHLWLGLISGLVLVVVCLTGTVYVYSTEIKELAAPELHHVQPIENSKQLGANQILDIVKGKVEGNVNSLSVFAAADRSYQISVKKEGDQSRFGTTYYVNPYTAEILGSSLEETWADKLMKDMFSLHRWLLLDRIEQPIIGELPNRTLGSYITGTATILFTLGLLTGIVIWIPQKIKNWRQGLKVKFNSNWKRLNHDLHNTLAFYSFIFLLLMGLTGPFWSFPWYRDGLQKTLGTYQEKSETPRGENRGSRNFSLTEAENNAEKQPTLHDVDLLLQLADFQLPYKGNYRINFPPKAEDPISLSKNRTGFFAPAAGDRLVFDSDMILTEIQIFRDKPFNERISSSVKALHVGDVYGKFSKLLYFLACLIATTLPITGTLIWINKLKKKNRKKRTASA
jgi:uncharacterized iron-regulated membrane protein